MHTRSILKAPAPALAAILESYPPWFSPAFLLLLLYAAFWPVDAAWAQALAPIATVATNIATALQGPFAIAVATIGLIGCGFMAMSGRMPWGSAIAVIGGIILIFGAATLVGEIQGVAN